MLGIPVTRDLALRVLKQLEEELFRDVAEAAQDGSMPRLPGYYAAWIDGHEERYLTLVALRTMVEGMPRSAVLKSEGG